jgi:hypothetical protein
MKTIFFCSLMYMRNVDTSKRNLHLEPILVPIIVVIYGLHNNEDRWTQSTVPQNMHLPHPHTTSGSISCKIYHRNFTSSKRDHMLTDLRYQSFESMLLRVLWWLENNDDILEKWRKNTCHVGRPLPEVDGAAYLLIGKKASLDGELEWGEMVARYLAVRRNGVCGLCESEGGAQISPADFSWTEPSSLYLLLAWVWHHGSPEHMRRGLLVRK